MKFSEPHVKGHMLSGAHKAVSVVRWHECCAKLVPYNFAQQQVHIGDNGGLWEHLLEYLPVPLLPDG